MTEHGWPGDPLGRNDPNRIGPYTVLTRLGAGGMGRIFLGRSPSGRLYAIKTIRSELGGDPGFRARFAQEVAAARRVSGVFTAAVVNADPDGAVPWLATAYVPAPSLEMVVRECGPLPPAAVRWLAAGIAEALESVHAAGLVHRDLKPSNVLVATDGPKVIDFGISRAADFGSLTMTGVAVGTPAYMSPEQAQGVREITPASDMFSLGSTLVYAATGHSPYPDRKPAEALLRLVTGSPELTGLPQELRALIDSCMQRAGEHRPTPTELLNTLGPLLDAEGYSDGMSRLTLRARAMVERFESQYRPAPGPATPPVAEPDPALQSRPDPEPPPGLDEGFGKLPGEVRHQRPQGAPPPAPIVAPTNHRQQERGAPASLVHPSRPAPPRPDTPPLNASPGGLPRQATADRPDNRDPSVRPLDVPRQHPTPPRTPTGGLQAPVWRFPATAEVLHPPVLAGQGASARVHVHSADNALHTLHLGTRDWRFDSNGWSTAPAVDDNLMFLSSQDQNVYALDLTTRQWKWSIPANGDVVAAPIAHNGTVYFGSSDQALYAVDAATGRLRWRFATGGWPTTATIDNGTVYFGSSDRCVYAVEAAGGWCRWRFSTGGWVSAPTVRNGVVHVGGTDHYLYLLDVGTGTMRGWFQAGGPVAQPVTDGSVSYFGSGDGCLYAVDVATQQLRWRVPGEGWVTSPVLSGSTVYAGNSAGLILAVDAANGQERWRFTAGGRVTSPVVSGGLLFTGCADRHLYVLDAATGTGPRT